MAPHPDPLRKNRKVVLITGCSSGIGAALAEEFHRLGHVVYATARKADDLAPLAEKGMRTLVLDITEPAGIDAAIVTIGAEQNGLDILINNAGFSVMGPMIEVGSDDLRRQFETNVIGPMAMVRAALPLLERRKGCVANVGSIIGLATLPFRGAYSASKAALHALSDALRMELKPFGIRVISVQPGGVRSRIADNATTALAPVSRYASILDALERDRFISQQGAMPTEIFARCLAERLLQPRTPAVIRIGSNSTLLPTLKRILPLSWLDRMLAHKFGLDRLP